MKSDLLTNFKDLHVLTAKWSHVYLNVKLSKEKCLLAFFQEFFARGEKSIVVQISFVLLIFLLFSDQISGGKSPSGENCLRGRPLPPCGRKLAVIWWSVGYGEKLMRSSLLNVVGYKRHHCFSIIFHKSNASVNSKHQPPRASPGVLHLLSTRVPGFGPFELPGVAQWLGLLSKIISTKLSVDAMLRGTF